MRVANAEANAARSWGDAIGKVTAAVGELLNDQDEGEGELVLSERKTQDQAMQLQLQQYLEDTPRLDLQDPEAKVPEFVREFASDYALTNDLDTADLRTADFATALLGKHAVKLQSDTYAALDKFSDSEKLQAKYNDALRVTMVGSAVSAMKLSTTQRKQEQAGRYIELYTKAVNSMDEAGAREALAAAAKWGVIPDDKLAELRADLGADIDMVRATQLLDSATRQGDVDTALEFIGNARLKPEQRASLSATAYARQNHLFTLQERGRSQNYATGMAMLGQGTLTTRWIDKMAGKFQLTGGQASALRSALRTGKVAASDPEAFDALKREVLSIRFPKGSISNTTDNADRVMRKIQTQLTGLTASGQFVQPTITADDAEELMRLHAEQLNQALGKGGQQYITARSMIKAYTKYSEMLDKRLGGAYPEGLAYAAFINALNDHMDTAGAYADPLDFVQRHQQIFDPVAYEKKKNLRLQAQFPQYASLIPAEVDGDINPLLDQAIKDNRAGILSTPMLRLLTYSFIYKQRSEYVESRTGTDFGGKDGN